MEKPFQLSALLEKTKGAIAPTAEAAAKAETQAVFAWLEESVSLLNPAVAAIANPLLEKLKAAVLEAEDAIDGIKGN